MKRENIFDNEFASKLKAFYSFDEGRRTKEDIGYRRTGRSTILARILLETAIESGREVIIQDHYIDVSGGSTAAHFNKTMIRKVAEEYETRGVNLDIKFHHSLSRFSAKIISGANFYYCNNINPFPIEKLKEQVEFLNKKLLLLL